MMKRYFRTEATTPIGVSVQITDTYTGSVFPEAEDNRHYREYAAWLEDGNQPDEVTCSAVCEIPQ